MENDIIMKVVCKYKRFTLIEVLAVIVILGILAGILTPMLLGRTAHAQADAAKIHIKSIEQSVNMFRIDMGRYPSHLDELKINPSNRRWKGPYWESNFRDPWGNDYIYNYPGQRKTFDIFSLGADGRSGGEGENAEIGNWDDH